MSLAVAGPEVGFAANRRLLAVERLAHDPSIGAEAISALTSPTGAGIPALPIDSHRTQALLAALVIFRLLPHGFRNRDLRAHLAPLLGTTAETMTTGQLSYDLRRLHHLRPTTQAHRLKLDSPGQGQRLKPSSRGSPPR